MSTTGMSTEEGVARALADSIPALLALMTPAGEVESVNQQVLDYYGATLEELKSWTAGNAVHPDDLPAVIAAWRQAVASEQPYDVEHRMRRADGVYRWFHVQGLPQRDADGQVARWCVLQTDIDDRKRTEALLAAEKQLLEMVTGGRPMSDTLEALCRTVESTAGVCYCSIMLIDPSGRHPEYGLAPSLPPGFLTSLIGRPVSEHWGPCAMAVHLNRQVIAADLAAESRWAAYEWYSMALAHGIRACWSTPISSAAGRVLGAFAIYFDEPTTPMPDQQSLIERFTHIASIAVERAQNDAALKHSEARKAAILDSAIDCIVTIDHEGCITEFNPAAERTFGYRRAEVVGKPLADVIIPPSLRDQHRRGFARYLATGEAHVLGRRVELTAIRADGNEFPVELAITRIPGDGPPCFTGYLRDITARKQGEERLRRSEAFLLEAQRLSSTGSYHWRVATDEITWSEQLYRIFELEPGVPVTLELIATRFHPDDLRLMHDMVDLAHREGSDFESDFRLQMPDHSIKYLHMVAHATRGPDGRTEYVGALQDVTERRLSDEALAEVRAELAHVARVSTLGALTASIAHEVNQPLSGIITNASTCLRMLAADPPNVDGARETARRTIRDGNRASEVITRLRALFAKREATTEPVDLNEATREVIALSLSELQRNRVVLRSELADDLPPVTGDRIQLQQVILNLLRNASDAMVGVDDRPRQLVVRTERDDGDRVRLTVEDAGVGFEPESVGKLFDAFYTTKDGGMGIGLSVSRSIIESHHGRLWAAPNDGPGATFAFSIPREPEGVKS
jgi:PAS domain S-box-containing protein